MRETFRENAKADSDSESDFVPSSQPVLTPKRKRKLKPHINLDKDGNYYSPFDLQVPLASTPNSASDPISPSHSKARRPDNDTDDKNPGIDSQPPSESILARRKPPTPSEAASHASENDC